MTRHLLIGALIGYAVARYVEWGRWQGVQPAHPTMRIVNPRAWRAPRVPDTVPTDWEAWS